MCDVDRSDLQFVLQSPELRSHYFGRRSFTIFPSMMMSPWSAVSSPAMHLKVVVFPHPDGPKRTTNSPFLTSSDRSSTATVPSYFFWRLMSRTSLIKTNYDFP